MTILNLNLSNVVFFCRLVACSSREIKYPKTSTFLLHALFSMILLNGFAYLFTHLEQINENPKTHCIPREKMIWLQFDEHFYVFSMERKKIHQFKYPQRRKQFFSDKKKCVFFYLLFVMIIVACNFLCVLLLAWISITCNICDNDTVLRLCVFSLRISLLSAKKYLNVSVFGSFLIPFFI